MEINKVICDDCVNGLTRIEDNKVDLIYLDPPFLHRMYNVCIRKKQKQN